MAGNIQNSIQIQSITLPTTYFLNVNIYWTFVLRHLLNMAVEDVPFPIR